MSLKSTAETFVIRLFSVCRVGKSLIFRENLKMGNQKQKWTQEEEDALLKGVAKHGPGKWKNILKDPDFAPSLVHRSNIDLKVYKHLFLLQFILSARLFRLLLLALFDFRVLVD